jgi:acetoin utilization deacetylase AcuC-like enzyme
MTDLLILTHPDCLDHVPPPGHPESPQRLTAVMDALEQLAGEQPGRVRIDRAAPGASDEALLRVHTARHLAQLEQLAPAPGARAIPLDPDTSLSAGSLTAARRAAGAVVAAVDAVLAGEAQAAFCAVRPPGHHAEPDQAMGFCLFNSVAVAARHSQTRHGLERVVVVDFDVHHGNGSQTLAEADPGFYYASIHQSPCYPGTGAAHDRASGNLLNVPVPPGADSIAWRTAFETQLVGQVAAWRPQLILWPTSGLRPKTLPGPPGCWSGWRLAAWCRLWRVGTTQARCQPVSQPMHRR